MPISDTTGAAQADLPVYAFDGTTYTGFHASTDAQGQVTFSLPEGNYRFRVDKNTLPGAGSVQYWSETQNHCTVAQCNSAAITVPVFGTVTVTVNDSTGAAQADLPVYAFDGTAYTGFHASTDAQGRATLALPQGNYHFRADVHGHPYWSSAENACSLPECSTAGVSVPRFGQVTVKMQYRNGETQADLPVYAFLTGETETYSGISGKTDASGQVQLWLPALAYPEGKGDYRFRSDLNSIQFWSGQAATCAVPGCVSDTVNTYAYLDNPQQTQTITYSYDGMNRLTAADYDGGIYFHYVYDALGNRLQETKKATASLPEVVNTCQYDVANRLTSANGVAYQWDANGNLLSDGVNTYTYDSANRLKTVNGGGATASYAYNGLGDRVSQTVNGATTSYTLDLNAGLTQVLADNTTTYLYGLNRVGQFAGTDSAYFLNDALGSVRQMVDSTDAVTLAKSYTPYGEVLNSNGDGQTVYGFTGEQQGGGLVYLRARYYQGSMGRFLTRDTWEGDQYTPMSYNPWLYGYGNPGNWVDPTGKMSIDMGGGCDKDHVNQCKRNYVQGKAGIEVKLLGGRNDLQAMANIINIAASVCDNFVVILPILTEVFNGVYMNGTGTLIAAATNPNHCAGVGREPRDCPGSIYYFSDKGFHPDFRDQHNQPYHVWGYIAEMASPGNRFPEISQFIGNFANYFHEIYQSNVDGLIEGFGLQSDIGWGTSWQDYTLSEAGMEIAELINQRKITPRELAGVILARLGPQGPGSNGRMDAFTQIYGPLAGQLNEETP